MNNGDNFVGNLHTFFIKNVDFIMFDFKYVNTLDTTNCVNTTL